VRAELERTVASRLRDDGQRFTGKRQELVEVLSEAGAPLTIPEVIERGRGLVQSSVYRNLAVLERAGVVQRVVTADGWVRFELAEDLTQHHHHLICERCGRVADVTLSDDLETALETTLAAAAGPAGFRIDHHRLDLVGRCASCE